MQILMSPNEQFILKNLLELIQPKRVLEIGSYQGGSLKIIRETLPNADIVSIEPKPEQLVYDLTENNIELIAKPTPSAFEDLIGKFDFIFIDGNHSYKNVVSDIQDSLKVLNPDGYILLHDSAYRDVKKAINDNHKDGKYLYKEVLTDYSAFDDKEYWGGLTLIHNTNFIFKWNRRLEFRPNTFDKMIIGEMDRQYREIDYSKCKTVIDIGAQAGYFVNRIKHDNPDLQIIAVEMATDNFELLSRNSQGLKNVDLVHAALSYRSNFKAIRWDDGNTGSGRLLNLTDENPKGTSILEISLDTITIEQIIERFSLDTIDVLKLDCEGSEWDIFTNISKDTTSKIKYIIGEYHGLADYAKEEIGKFAKEHGFKIHSLSNTNGLGFFFLEQHN